MVSNDAKHDCNVVDLVRTGTLRSRHFLQQLLATLPLQKKARRIMVGTACGTISTTACGSKSGTILPFGVGGSGSKR